MRTLLRRQTAVDRGVIAAAAAATLVLVLPFYARRPFWFDELVSVEIASLPVREFADYVSSVESNMALYHALLAPWLELGTGEGWVRTLSILFALGTLPYVYFLGLRLFGRTAAVLAVVMLAVNVSFVGHARDARGYGLALLLVTASSYHLVRGATSASRRHWALYAGTAALAVWAHLLAAPVLLAQGLWLLLEGRSVPRRLALRAFAAVGVLVAPLVLAVLISRQGSQLDWLGRPRLQQLPGLAEWFVESRLTLVLYFVGAAAALVAANVDRRSGTRPRWYSLLLLWLVLPPAAVFALSSISPVYLYRYFLVCLPALVLLVAAGFARLRPAWLGVALAAVTIALSVRTTVTCQPDCKIRHDDWRSAAAYVAEHAQKGDAIVAYPREIRTPLDHYLGSTRPRLLFPNRWGLTGDTAAAGATVGAAVREGRTHSRIWLVTWWLPSEEARAAIAATAVPLDAREFPGNVRVELYRRR